MTEQNTKPAETEDFNPWQKAFAKQDEQKEEREGSKGFSDFTFEEVTYEGLAIDKSVVFRIIGNPAEYRQAPSDAKIVLQSKMVADNSKNKPKINWPYIEEKGKYIIDPDWGLSKILNKVLESKWVIFTEEDIDGKNVTKNAEGKIVNGRGYNGRYEDIHTNTQCFKRLKFNQTVNEKKSFGDASPGTRVICNVLSRMDEWCKTEKHTKLLATKIGRSEKVNDKGEKIVILFPETGISKSMYDDILGYVRQINLNPNVTDLVVTRTHNSDKYSQTIFDGNGLIQLGRGAPELLALINPNPITEEELAYEQYDLDKLFKVASYSKIKKHFSGLFKMFDTEFSDNLYDELCALAKEEELQRAKDASADTDKAEATKVEASTDTDCPFDPDPPKVEEVAPAETKAVREPRKPAESVNAVNLTSMPFWSTLNDNDKEEMTKTIDVYTSIDDVKFKADAIVIPCSVCGRDLPNTVFTCPLCGTEL